MLPPDLLRYQLGGAGMTWIVNDHVHGTFAGAVICPECHMIPRNFPPDLPTTERRRAVSDVLYRFALVSHRANNAMSKVKEAEHEQEMGRLREFIHIWTQTS